MSLIVRHYGKIQNGKKIYYNTELYKKQLESLEGQEFEEIIKKRYKKVSTDQHAYYRGAILQTAHQHESFSHFNKADDIHEDVIAPMFLSYIKPIRLKNIRWDKLEVTSTSSLSKEDMSKFIEKVLAWLAVEFGIEVLSPEDYYLKLSENGS
jgi:hypothetical protein